MTPKERVHAALRRQPVDRVPIFMWFHPVTVTRLAALLEVPPAAVGDVMGNDVHTTWVNNNYAMEAVVHAHDGETHTDEWGITWVKQGAFNQIAHSPLGGASPAQMQAYVFPEDQVDALVARLAPLASTADRYFLGADVSPCVFEMYCRLRGMEDGLLDLHTHPAAARQLLGRCADFALRLSRLAADRYPLDWLWTGDDVAGQQAPLLSPRLWRDLVKPHLARVVAEGRRRQLWVAYHCCGAVRPLIADLIELGVDVLNPIQCNCPGMDPLALKKEFGRHLAFMGGVDTQDLLPNGSVADVRRATRRLLDGMTANGGGYILAASHSIPPETSLDNIFAMYAEAGVTKEAIFDAAAAYRQATAKG